MFLEKRIRINSHSISKLINEVLQWFLPCLCILCGQKTSEPSYVCKPCQEDLPILPQCCSQCANFLRINQLPMPREIEIEPIICGSCLSTPPPFDETYALFPYEPPIIQLIIALKFHGKLSHAKAFSHLFLQKIPLWYQHKPLPDVLIPMPLHPKRLRERGFNQALEIARPIAKSLAMPLDISGTIRIKHTKAQSGLSKADRKRNMAHAFMIKGNYKDLRVAVIDDVITTGETTTEFCQLLRANGAKNIHVWCCARRG